MFYPLVLFCFLILLRSIDDVLVISPMDTRYLKRRGQRWYFQVAVPKDLQPVVGRRVIVEALNTSALAAAQQLRWKRLAAAHAAFEAAGQPTELTPATVAREAQATLSRLLREAEAAAGRGEPLQWAAPDAAAGGRWPDGITEGEGLTFALETFAEAIKTRNYGLVEVEAAAVVISLDLGRHPEDAELDAVCQSQLVAHYEAIKARLAHLRGQDYTPAEPLARTLRQIHGGATLGTTGRRFDRGAFAASAKTVVGDTGMPRVSEAAAACLAAHTREQDGDRRTRGWSAQTRRQYAGVYDLLAGCLGDAPLATVTDRDATRFIDAIAGLDPRWRRAPGADGLAFDELVGRHSAPPGLSRKTVDRYVAAGQALFNWARAAGHFDGDNPFNALAGRAGRPAAHPALPYTAVQLNNLFGAPVFRRRPAAVDSTEAALVWGVLLALFGGLRLDEISRLKPDDVRQSDGIWVIDVGRRPRKRGRLVPVHQTLLDLGWLDQVGQAARLGAGALLPAAAGDVGPARLVRALTQVRRHQGLASANGARQGFRALRATARAALVRAGTDGAVVAHLLGDRQRRAPAVQTLAAGIDDLDYPGLDLVGVLGGGAGDRSGLIQVK